MKLEDPGQNFVGNAMPNSLAEKKTLVEKVKKKQSKEWEPGLTLNMKKRYKYFKKSVVGCGASQL
jgi:hypothetical protein